MITFSQPEASLPSESIDPEVFEGFHTVCHSFTPPSGSVFSLRFAFRKYLGLDRPHLSISPTVTDCVAVVGTKTDPT